MRTHPIRTALAVALLACLPVSAETLLTHKTSAEGLREPQTSQTWFGEGKLREDKGKRTTIVDLEAKKVFLVDHDAKTYHELSYPVDLREITPPDMHPYLDQLESQMALDVEVAPTDERKTIEGRDTRRWNVTIDSGMGYRLNLTFWVAQDLGFDATQLKRLLSAAAATQPMGREMVDKVMEIDGFPVLTEIRTQIGEQVVETKEELVSIQQIAAPEGTFAPPADYRRTPFDYRKAMPPEMN